jgi:hypothetical protein
MDQMVLVKPCEHWAIIIAMQQAIYYDEDRKKT